MAFDDLVASNLPKAISSLHFEIFDDGPGFYCNLFGFDSDMCQLDNAAIDYFNDQIDALWPIISDDEYDALLIWEDDPEFGQQIATDQPIYALNLLQLVVPWFRAVVSNAKNDLKRKITIAIHDFGEAEEL